MACIDCVITILSALAIPEERHIYLLESAAISDGDEA